MSLQSLRIVAPWILAVLLPLGATAQDEPDLWRSRLELGFTGASGNTSFSILSGAVSLTRLEQERFEFELSGRVRWGRSDERVIANDMQTTTKLDWLPQSDLSPFAYATVSRDVVRNLAARIVGGGGAKWTVWRASEESRMSLSGAAVLDFEKYRLQPDAEGPEDKRVVRWSGRVKLDRELGSATTFQHVTFWQPRVSDFGDYVVDVVNSLSTDLLANLSLVIEHSYVHQELPPPGAARDDQRLAIVLRVSL